MMESPRQAYRIEAYELLAELETSLLALEETPEDQELISRIFRAMHTIKGSGSMFGFNEIASFAHELETAFDLVRNERMTVTKMLIDLSLAGTDLIRFMLDDPHAGNMSENETARNIIASLHNLSSTASQQPGAAASSSTTTDTPDTEIPSRVSEDITESPPGNVTYRIRIRLAQDVFVRGTNPILLLNELRDLGECRVTARLDDIPDLEAMDPEKCYTYWNVILTTDRGIDAVKDVFIFVEDECDLKIQIIDVIEPAVEPTDDISHKKLGNILVERGDIGPEEIQKVLGKQKRIGQLLVEDGAVTPDQVTSALAEQEHIKGIRRSAGQVEQTSSIRVPAERLDKLVNLVGELVTVQARLSQTVSPLKHAGLLSISEEVERLITELRDNTMSIRMLPIGTTFSKFKRLVRDLSNDLGKEVTMLTEGAETELDKTVIDRLNDPLVHLIRNSIDHGIEMPHVREAAGKPREGTVQLSAEHSGASVLIRIRDDGAGLNAAAIRRKAEEKGLLAPGTELSEKETFALIFAPGFSTAQKVTGVSGRGVGMDVVKRSIDTLRGSIDIAGREGEGTTVTLKLPLTLAIIDGLLVQLGKGRFVLPLSIVEECVELTRQDASNSHGKQITYVRGEIVPYIQLRDRFGIPGTPPDVQQIVITESAEGRVGFVVDKVIGEHQTVIKSMGRMFRDVDVISGATILGDGTVALIIDIPKLVHGMDVQEGR